MSRNRIEQHPDEFRRDLNPTYEAGENHGHNPEARRSAYDIKDLHDLYPQFRDDVLKQIPVLVEGTRLQQGGVYLDLRHPQRGEFKAMGNMEAGRNHWIVAKNEVDHQIWNRLIGVDDPDRLAAGETEQERAEDAPLSR